MWDVFCQIGHLSVKLLRACPMSETVDMPYCRRYLLYYVFVACVTRLNFVLSGHIPRPWKLSLSSVGVKTCNVSYSLQR